MVVKIKKLKQVHFVEYAVSAGHGYQKHGGTGWNEGMAAGIKQHGYLKYQLKGRGGTDLLELSRVEYADNP